MKISKSAVGILISMVLLSILFANVVNLLSTDATVTKEHAKENVIAITDTNDHLIWFMQITDIHISIFRDPVRITEFKEFCQLTVDAIQPSVVLASGDLTDAKTSDGIGSHQFKNEWVYYRDILKETRMQDKTLWLDIRGNHDNFNVANIKSKENYFPHYSIQGKKYPGSYMYQIKKGEDTYTFIAIDACLKPGPRRPFNFIGLLDDLEVNEIKSLINKTENSMSNYTVWFGHFPTSCILTPGSASIRDVIGNHRNGLVYLCGHLHRLGGAVTKMYTLQKAGFLELELGDWKDNRMYRLLVIDHGMLSFVDIEHRNWPVAVVTNPKHALFINPQKENVENIKTSTHIRILAFSLSSIVEVKIKIDNGVWIDAEPRKSPLYVVKWDPKQYLSGIHDIEIFVKDADGREKIFSQPFSLDGTQLSFDLLARMVLMTNATTMFQFLFGSMVIVSCVPLCLMRYLHTLSTKGKIAKPSFRGGFLRVLLRKFWILSTVDRLFYPLILYPIYLVIGPWSVGYLIEDHIGAIFAWGIIVTGSYLPGSFTYVYGFIQLFTFHVPLTIILAHSVDVRFGNQLLKRGKKISWIRKTVFHIPFLLVYSLQLIMAFLFWLAYGTLAFVLGPLRTWSLVLAAVLYFWSLNLPERSFRRATDVWQVKTENSGSNTNLNTNS